MRSLFSAMLFTLLCFSAMGQCDGNRYRNFLFTDFAKTADIVYGENLNKDGLLEELKMDVYVPEGDVSTERALIIISHGGFFLGGDKAEADVVPFCEDFARMGYVVASINYRMGIEFETPLNVPYGKTVVRAVQDLRAAIRWFRQDAEGGNQFGINPDEIYTGGVSAGGFMAIHLAYMDDEEIPDYIDMTAPGLEGGLEGESGNPGYSSEVNAIFNISGAIGDTAWIDAGELPVCLFHGDADATVPFDSDTFYLFGIMEVVELDGSNSIDQKLTQVGIEHCFEINEGYGHVPHMGNEEVYDTTLSIISNFLSHYICGNELDCTYREIETIVSVEEQDEAQINIWPNPSHTGAFRFSADTPIMSLQVSDSAGREVWSTLNPKSESILLPTPGFYILHAVLFDGKMISRRLIVE